MLGNKATVVQCWCRCSVTHLGHKSQLEDALLFSEAGGAVCGEPQSYMSGCQGPHSDCPPAPAYKSAHTDELFIDIDSVSLQMSVVVANKDWETQKPAQFCGGCCLVFGGVSESCVSHLSGVVREADGALWRSIKQV